MLQQLRTWQARVGASALVVACLCALLSVPTAPASADPMPPPTADYEAEALQMCADGDVQCVRHILETMRQHTRQLADSCDHNAVFAALYTIVTKHYYQTVRSDASFFDDPAFVNNEDAAFAYYYFFPFINHRNGVDAGVPPAWRVAFDAADSRDVKAAGNLLLAVNAHVVRDLPFVLAELGLGQKDDHDRVNRILDAAYGPAMRAIDKYLADEVDDTDVRGTELDERVLFRLVTTWREQAWRDAQALSAATTPAARRVVATEIEQKALRQAQTFRLQFSYGPDSRQRAQRDDYCAQRRWPHELTAP